MIAALTGKVFSRTSDRAVIDVGGVGYEVFLSSDSLARLPARPDETFLHIHTHVREDAIVLFGFLEEEEKEMFLLLNTVSGVGPKLALAILSGMKVGELSKSISGQDFKRLTTLKGVGKKTAERICVELKDKVEHLGPASGFASEAQALDPAEGSVLADTISALNNLGYPEAVVRQALTAVRKRLGQEKFAELGITELIRESLRSLA